MLIQHYNSLWWTQEEPSSSPTRDAGSAYEVGETWCDAPVVTVNNPVLVESTPQFIVVPEQRHPETPPPCVAEGDTQGRGEEGGLFWCMHPDKSGCWLNRHVLSDSPKKYLQLQTYCNASHNTSLFQFFVAKIIFYSHNIMVHDKRLCQVEKAGSSTFNSF